MTGNGTFISSGQMAARPAVDVRLGRSREHLHVLMRGGHSYANAAGVWGPPIAQPQLQHLIPPFSLRRREELQLEASQYRMGGAFLRSRLNAMFGFRAPDPRFGPGMRR